jgi:hypothetical protein
MVDNDTLVALQVKQSALEAQIHESGKAVALLQAFADRTPTTMDVQNDVKALREVVMEMFRGVSNQFLQNDKALTAALQAQEKQAIATNVYSAAAITKSEAQTADAIRSLGILFDTANRATNAKVDEIKSRLDRGEGRTVGTTEVVRDSRDNLSLIVAAIAVAVAIAVAFLKH